MSTLPVNFRIALTGTPVMNNLSELWSITQCLNPGYFGAKGVFLRFLEDAISVSRLRGVSEREKVMGAIALNRLSEVLDPMMLRMTKDSLSTLRVTKTELLLWTPLLPMQKALYDAILKDSHFCEQLNANIDSKIVPFQLISYLRKSAGHPAQMTETDAKFFSSSVQEMLQRIWRVERPSLNTTLSSKLNLLTRLCKHLHAEERKVLIFSEHTTTLDIIQEMLDHLHYSFLRVDGSMTSGAERAARCERFNHDKSIFAFLLTIGVGGYGLNLTGADRVILFEPVWNPLMEKQAVGRVYRLHQRHNVITYRLVGCNTIEERLTARQLYKTALANCVVDRVYLERLVGRNDIMDLFKTSPDGPEVCETAEIMCKYLNPWERMRENLTAEEYESETQFLQRLLEEKAFVRLGLYEDVGENEDDDTEGELLGANIERGDSENPSGATTAVRAKLGTGKAGEAGAVGEAGGSEGSEARHRPPPRLEPVPWPSDTGNPSEVSEPLSMSAPSQVSKYGFPGVAMEDGAASKHSREKETRTHQKGDYSLIAITEKEVPTIKDLRKFQTAKSYNRRPLVPRRAPRAATKRDTFDTLESIKSEDEMSSYSFGSEIEGSSDADPLISLDSSEIVDLTKALDDKGREAGPQIPTPCVDMTAEGAVDAGDIAGSPNSPDAVDIVDTVGAESVPVAVDSRPPSAIDMSNLSSASTAAHSPSAPSGGTPPPEFGAKESLSVSDKENPVEHTASLSSPDPDASMSAQGESLIRSPIDNDMLHSDSLNSDISSYDGYRSPSCSQAHTTVISISDDDEPGTKRAPAT